jgi:hypothetical protein
MQEKTGQSQKMRAHWTMSRLSRSAYVTTERSDNKYKRGKLKTKSTPLKRLGVWRSGAKRKQTKPANCRLVA